MRYLVFNPENNFYSFGNIETEQVPDFTIYCHGYIFAVHRLLLQNYIPYFGKMYDFKEGKAEELVLDDPKYNPDVIHALLAFCHCRQLDLDMEVQEVGTLLEHAGYWQYDEFILWFIRSYIYADFIILFEALKQVIGDLAKVEIGIMILPLITAPLQEDGHVFLNWLADEKPEVRQKILNDPSCPKALQEGYKLISGEITFPKFSFYYTNGVHTPIQCPP